MNNLIDAISESTVWGKSNGMGCVCHRRNEEMDGESVKTYVDEREG